MSIKKRRSVLFLIIVLMFGALLPLFGETTFNSTEETLYLYNSSIAVYENTIAYTLDENTLGEDRNGDGDFTDLLIYTYDVTTRQATATGEDVFRYCPIAFDSNKITYVVHEWDRGGDLNGDGDNIDFVLMYYDVVSQQAVSTGISPDWSQSNPAISGNRIAVTVDEYAYGSDLNGDGDYNDRVLGYYEVGPDAFVNTAIEVTNNVHASISGDDIIFIRYENELLVDLNGDGDQVDTVLSSYNITSGTVSVLDVTVCLEDRVQPVIDEGIIALVVKEADYAIDKNSDGDQYDRFVAYYDLGTDTLTITENQHLNNAVRISKGTIIYVGYEDYVGIDVNEDGTMFDKFLGSYTIATGENVYLPFSPALEFTQSNYRNISAAIYDTNIALMVPETDMNQDLTGDEDMSDEALIYFSIAPPVSNEILGFESLDAWVFSKGAGTLNTVNKTEGTASIEVFATSYVEIKSDAIDTEPLAGNTMLLDIMVGTDQSNPYWTGAIQLYFDSNSAGLFNMYAGQVHFSTSGLGTFKTLSFTLPASVANAVNGNHDDLKISLGLNADNAGSGPYVLDNIRFVQK